MSKKDFIDQPKFQELLKKARTFKDKKYSDVIDKEGNQYVDLVQEGGGVLGIALVGYTYVLEEIGIRFMGLAGTSAGAINTMAMAGTGKINDRKSGKVLEALAEKDLFEFVDGDPKLKSITQEAIDGKPLKKLKWKLLVNIKKIKKALLDDLGLNPGKDFEDWINGVLKNGGEDIKTIGDLMKLRDKKNFPEGLQKRNGDPVTDELAQVYIITSDITTQTKVKFPEMAPLYWGKDYIKQPPSSLVRASMSVPFFFLPFEIKNIPNAGKKNDKMWNDMADYHGEVPKSAKFVDGGMLSNFPINVFHVTRGIVPSRPTFGARLSSYRDEFTEVDGLGSFVGSLISTMRHDGDIEFLVKNPDYDNLICFINADKHFKWLNFNMTLERQKELFLLGATKAVEFLGKFNWEDYKEIRKKITI